MNKSFPDAATKEEKKCFNLELGHTTDDDLEVEKAVRIKNPNYDVRILLRNDDNKLCVVKSEKFGYIQLPGGGMEAGETIEEAVRRETREETGYEVVDLEPLGYYLDDRNRSQKTVFVYTANAGENVGTNYTNEEIEDGFTPIWMDIEAVIQEIEEAEKQPKSYNGTFATRRDLILMRFYTNNIS